MRRLTHQVEKRPARAALPNPCDVGNPRIRRNCVQMQTFKFGPVQLTAREVRSLRALKIPNWWRSEVEIHHRKTTDTIPSRFRSFRIAPDLLPSLRVQYLWRHRLNPRALVGVGEHGTFVHLHGVGTHWRTNGHGARIFEGRFLLCRAFWQGLGWLLSIHPRRLNLYRKTLLPYLPPPCALSYRHEDAARQPGIPPLHERHANDYECVENHTQEARDGTKKEEAS